MSHTHNAAYGLNHIHLRLAGREEQYRIKGGNVHTFGKAAHVGNNAAIHTIPGRVFEPS